MDNPFYIKPSNPGQPIMAGINSFVGQSAARKKEQQNQEKMEALLDGIETGDYRSAIELAALDPKISEAISKVKATHDDAKISSINDWISGLVASDYSDEYAAQDNPELEIDEKFRSMPKEQRRLLATLLAGGTMEEQQFNAAFGKPKDRDNLISSASPKDFTSESLSAYQVSGDPADLVRFSPKVVEFAGVPHQLNPETQKYERIIDAESQGLSDDAARLAELEADQESRRVFGKERDKWKSGKPQYRSKIASAEASQKILVGTAEQIEKNIGSATTEYGAKLANWPGAKSRTLRNQLNTFRAHSAFSTLTDLKASGGTLGAISAAELELLEAKLGALDQAGESEEILRVIDQIINANQGSIDRLRDKFNETDDMYSGSYDKFQRGAEAPEARDIADMSDEDLFNF